MELISLINNIENLYKGQPWYGSSFSEILDSIKSGNPNATFNRSNSLGQILEHMTQWKHFVIEKVNGNKNFKIEMNSIQDWNKGKKYSQEEFLELIQNFKTVSEELITTLKNKNNNFLKETVPGEKYTFEFMLEGVIHHDIYHSGQLSILKKS